MFGWLGCVTRTLYEQIMAQPGMPDLRRSVLSFGLACFLYTWLHKGLPEALLGIALGAASWAIPFTNGVGIAWMAFVMAAVALALHRHISFDQPPLLPWIVFCSIVTMLSATFTGGSITVWILPAAAGPAAWGVYSFWKTWNLKGSLAGTFALAYWANLIGADTLRLWPNLPAIQRMHQETGQLLSIGGVGWGDGLFRIPLTAILLMLITILPIIMGSIPRSAKPPNPTESPA